MLKMLRLRAYSAPENVAASHLTRDLEAALSENGIRCENYAPTPSRGLSKAERLKYKKVKYEQSYGGMITFHRFAMFPEGRNPLQKAARYFCCGIAEYFKGIRAKDIDLVYSGSTPPTQGLLSALVAKKLSRKYRRAVPFVYNLQDVFPDSLINAGLTHQGSLLWKIGRKIEDDTYARAKRIIVISDSFKKNLMDKGVPENKIVVVSNWIDLDEVREVPRAESPLARELGLDDRNFVVVYAGNFGEAQGAEVVLQAANLLKDQKEIRFAVFGGGVHFPAAKEASKHMDNVMVRDLLPQSRVSEVYSLGNVALITCKPGTGSAGMPSKTWSIMACNTPIIASFDEKSDLADVLAASGAGTCVRPADADALADAILKAYHKWLNHETQSKNLREYVRCHASKTACVRKYIDIILDAASVGK